MSVDKPSQALSVSEIAQHIRDAAGSQNWRDGSRIEPDPGAVGSRITQRWMQIHQALKRARGKAFVPAIKPLRRLLRNQGAVNDSMIEALSQLVDEVEELANEQRHLQKRLNMLEAELRQARANEPPQA